MDQETYEHHKQQLANGKIVRIGGRIAATPEELDTLRHVDDLPVFGGQSTLSAPGEILAINSGRLSPEDIEAMGPEHPVIVAAQKLTLSQLDALVDHVTDPLLDELKAKDDQLKAKDDEIKVKEAGASLPAPTLEDEMTLSEDPREQGVQAQMVTGATDNITPKTVLDNKTDAPAPAGKNASKAAADAAQDQEKAAAKTTA